MWRCVAVCGGVLQCVAVWCSVWQGVVSRGSVLQCVAAYCSVLQCVCDEHGVVTSCRLPPLSALFLQKSPTFAATQLQWEPRDTLDHRYTLTNSIIEFVAPLSSSLWGPVTTWSWGMFALQCVCVCVCVCVYVCVCVCVCFLAFVWVCL